MRRLLTVLALRLSRHGTEPLVPGKALVAHQDPAELGVRYLFILGPHSDIDYKVAEHFILGMNLQSLFVVYSMAEQRPYTAEEIEEHSSGQE